MTKYLSDNLELLKQWIFEKNSDLGLFPEQLTCGSNKNAWWKCSKGHKWQAPISRRTMGVGCPYCSNKKVLIGYNDLFTTNPELKNKWDFNKNTINPEEVTKGNESKVWWICEKGHSYQQEIYTKTKNPDWCGICSGAIIVPGINDLESMKPEIANEWNYNKNKNEPSQYSCYSNKKVWWICEKGHEWEAKIGNRCLGRGCPICANKIIVKGYNDLFTTNPELKELWNYKKNKISPFEISNGCGKKVWWICEKGHEWEEVVKTITSGCRCPYCSGHRVFKGYNDLLTTNPELEKEWNYKKNDKSPDKYSQSSAEKVWWICFLGHEWKASIYHRTRGRGCPICNSTKQTSFPEQAIFHYLIENGISAINRYKDIFDNGMEIDVYLPDYKIGIEYDGCYYHKEKASKDRENKKYQICISNKIKLIRIREDGLLSNENSDYVILSKWNSDNYNELDKMLKKLFEFLNLDINVNTYKDRIKILEKYKTNYVENNQNELKPELLKEWNSEKNKSLKIENFSKSSGIKVWWKCSKGHEWQATIAKRNKGQGCPICSNLTTLVGYNDLFTTNPELEKEWNYKKNININPKDMTSGTPKKAWWICKKGHEWEASINHRAKRNHGCPICLNRSTLVGYNDLFTTNPELEKEWNYKKNININPKDMTSGTPKKAWWICEKGHEWEASINHRTKRKTGCPICSNKQIIKGVNDLFTLKPELEKEWNYEKNIGINPYDLGIGTPKKVWWKCEKGHEWEVSISNRKKGSKCPYCCNQKILKGYNDITTTNPKLLECWAYEKNNIDGILPETLGDGSGKKVWWKCKNNHYYERRVIDQKAKNNKCPMCQKEK